MAGENSYTELRWYAMRDLSRRHAKAPAYKQLTGMGFEVFTPMTHKLVAKNGRPTRKEVPFMQDLLFVHDTQERLNPVVRKIENLQYRFLSGGYCVPMIVRDNDMERFIHAVQSSRLPRFFRPEEVTREMCGQYVRIVGGNLDGYEGYLLSVQGSKYKRLLVELPNFITAAIEIQPEFIEILA